MNILRQTLAAVRLLLVMTVLLGIAYPLAITGIAQVVAPVRANGSMLTNGDGQVVGSALIGQTFEEPEWFQGRASASDYSGETSGGSNLSPVSSDQLEARSTREANLRAANPDAVGPVADDALTASASGLDPHISLAYALWQVPRVAKTRGIEPSQLTALIAAATEPAPLGFLGQDGVNVTRLNHSLTKQ